MANTKNNKQEQKARRKKRVRAKIFGSKIRPRLSVFRSLKHLSVQLIDDNKGVTLASVKDQEIKKKGKKIDLAFEIGELIAAKAIKAGIKEIVFDRSGYQYHGRVKAVAEGARKGGLKF